MAGNQEKTFKHYLELPEKVRNFVIDEQEPDDRVRFTRCSKICNQEAKGSKNYIYELRLTTTFVYNEALIEVSHGKRHGYNLFLRTSNYGEKQIAQHKRGLDRPLIWEVVWNSSRSMREWAIEEFKKLLHLYQNKIKKLEITNHDLENDLWDVDFGIQNLENLEDLAIITPTDVQQFLSKIHHPLKLLWVSGEYNIPLPKNYKQIMQVPDLNWETVELDYEQLIRLSAEKAEIGIGNLTERDIFKFIRSWQDGSIGKEIKRYEWNYNDSNFDEKKLRRLLRLEDHDGRYYEIKHFTQAGKRAALSLSRDYICFEPR